MKASTRWLASALLFGTISSVAEAQETVDLGSSRMCGACELVLEPFLSLGEDVGEGIIESEEMQVVAGGSPRVYMVFRIGTSQLLLFDGQGRFLRRVGREGQGPGEIQTLVDAHITDSGITTLDFSGPRITTFDLNGIRREDARVDIRPGRFRMVTDSMLVVGSMDRRPDIVGFPLHLVRIRDGTVLDHFGSTRGDWVASDAFAQDVVVGWSTNAQRVWHGQRSRLQLEEWDVGDRRLVRRIVGDLSWLRAAGENSPPPHVLQFGVDGSNRLWLSARVPDPEWRRVQPQGAEGLITDEKMADFFDTRVDVFDLASRRHVGTARFDEAFVGLVFTDDGVLLQRVTFDDAINPRVSLYRPLLPQ